MLSLVTGAASGIGAATFRQFQKAGFAVIGLDKIEAENTIICDLADNGQIINSFNIILEKYGTPQILINNAGIYLTHPWDALTADDFDQTISINCRAQFLLSQIFAKELIKHNLPGNIVNISSVVGHAGSGDTAYGASKGAINAMTKSLAKSLAPHNIRVNAVAPGLIDTEMGKSIPPDRREKFAASTAMRRFGKAEEVAQAVFFLASAQSSYITGAVLNVDGGLY